MDVRKQLRRLATAVLVAVVVPACDSGGPTSPSNPGSGTTITGVTVTATPNPVKMPTGVQVMAAVAPASASQSVQWTSSNPIAASVSSSGAVTPLRQGTVTITATSTVDQAKSGSVTLTIQCPDPRLVTANLTSDTNWQNWVPDPTCFDYVVQAALSINDEVLTIDPGTVVGFEAGLQLRVRGSAGLVAAGTAAEPIVLTGTTKQRGFWKGVSLENRTFAGNVIQHTTIEHTGAGAISGTQDASLIVINDVSVQLENTTLQESTGYGLWLDRTVDITGNGANTMTKNALGAAWAFGSSVDHVTQGGSTVVGNDNDVVVVSPRAITQDASWGPAIYHVLRANGNSFDVRADLTLAAGTELRFDAGQPMRIMADGGLSAVGTVSSPIVFTGTQATPGHWQGLSFINSTSPINRLEHVVVEWGGGQPIGTLDGANVIVRPTAANNVMITNTTMRGSSGYGLYAGRLAVLNGFANNTMTGNAVGPAYVSAQVVGYLMPGNSFTGNGTDEIRVETGTPHPIEVDATWSDFGVPYFLQHLSGSETRLSATLTLEPGVDLQFGPGIGFRVNLGGSLVALGTQQNHITLSGRAGLWKGILVSASIATFDFVDFVDTGSSPWGIGATQPAAVSLTTFASHASMVTFSPEVTFSGSGFDVAFGFGQTFATGCPASAYIPTNDVRSDHCL